MPFVKGQARPAGAGRRRRPAAPQLAIVYRPLAWFRPYERNPRKNDGAVDRMCASIEEYGFTIPVLARSTGDVIDGHLRLKAALKLKKFTELPVILCDGWSEAQVKAFRLMVNRSVTWADWDLDALALEFGDLKALEFDLTLTGFELTQVDSYLRGLATAPEYNGMPEFTQADKEAWQTVKVHLRNEADRNALAKLLDQKLTEQTKYVWFPDEPDTSASFYRYADDGQRGPKYPVYVISKGRAESRLTAKALEKIGVAYRIVVEPQEYDLYAAVIDPAKILTLPFSNLGQGSIPARNWVWEHSISEHAARHWILDDNIAGFFRLNDNLKVPVTSGAIFAAAEDFVDRFTNVALAGFQYDFLAKRKQKIGPVVLNTRIYSTILIDNALQFRWRGRYNEDTDLSLRVLKAGLCTVEFNSFLSKKAGTMIMKGGNTDELYKGNGRLEMAKSLQQQHPDVVTVVKKFNRWQHQVDYRPFRSNRFILRPGFAAPAEMNEYGMRFEYTADAALREAAAV